MLIGYMLFMKALRRRRQRASKDPLGIIASTTLNGVHFVSVPTTPPRAPSSMAQAYAQAQSTGPTPPLSPYMSSHEHSVASLNLMSLTSPTSPRFTANMTPPITDAADMISPFFVTSPSRPQEGGNTATSKAAEAQIERVLSPPGQRARLNPPPYSAASPTASSGSAPPSRRLSLKQTLKRKGSTSGGTMHSGHSAASTRGSGKGRPRAARMTSDGSVDSTGSAGTANSAGRGAAGSSRRAMSRVERTNTSDARPPAV
ncbi:hypothetical protein BS17DRAFT_785644 [Gyrodon lividus]|nr:hypothetical protein BS17DRAFT_785644 [Gyrodon lividus]